MNRILFLSFVLLSPFSQLVAIEGIYAGSIKDNGECFIHCTFGVEQYSPKNELFKFRKQIWEFQYVQKPNARPVCELERQVVDNLDQSMGKSVFITRHEHSIEKGNLTLKNVDLTKGILDCKRYTQHLLTELQVL